MIVEPSGRRGLIHYAHGLCSALADAGHQVLLATSVDFETRGVEGGYEAMEVFDRLRPRVVKLLRFFTTLASTAPDVVHIQGAVHPALYLVLMKAARLVCGARIVYTAHEVAPVGKKGAIGGERTLTRLYAGADAVIVHAAPLAGELSERFGVPAEKVFVLPMGNNFFLSRIDDKIDSLTEGAGGGKTVLFFGIIEPRKGLMHLVRAFAHIRRRVPEARLRIVGQPYEDVTPYLEEIERLGIGDAVETSFGYVPMEEIPRHFRSAHVVVLPYTYTAQSAVVATAYAFSKPVVTTDVGGLPEMVEHGESGLLVPSGDEDRLADAVAAVLEDDGLRQRMGRRAGELAATRLGWDAIAKETLKVYGA